MPFSRYWVGFFLSSRFQEKSHPNSGKENKREAFLQPSEQGLKWRLQGV
jgi:hypothetical protein